MKRAINVYEYGRGGKCVYIYILRYTFTGIRIINIQIEKEDRHMSRVMRITRALCLRYVLISQEKKKKNKEVAMNTIPNTNHAALATQLERQVEKTAYTYDTGSKKQANRQGMGWGETEAIIGKAPGMKIHTRHSN